MTNNQKQQREFELNLDFLKDGKNYRMTSFEDGVNANDKRWTTVKKNATLKKEIK